MLYSWNAGTGDCPAGWAVGLHDSNQESTAESCTLSSEGNNGAHEHCSWGYKDSSPPHDITSK